MKNFIFALVASIAVGQSIHAVLPPLYQSSNEIKAILNNEELGEALNSGELITNIKRVEDGYEITTNQNTVKAEIVYTVLSKPGPALFKVKFHTPVPLVN